MTDNANEHMDLDEFMAVTDAASRRLLDVIGDDVYAWANTERANDGRSFYLSGAARCFTSILVSLVSAEMSHAKVNDLIKAVDALAEALREDARDKVRVLSSVIEHIHDSERDSDQVQH